MEISHHSPPPIRAAPLDYRTQRTISWKPVRKAIGIAFIMFAVRYGTYFAVGMQTSMALVTQLGLSVLLSHFWLGLDAIICLSALAAGVTFLLENRRRGLVAFISLASASLSQGINLFFLGYQFFSRTSFSSNGVRVLASTSGEVAIVIALGAVVYFDHRVGPRTELQPV